ncbi:MAG: bamD, partial [Daejeonella sp.]|nr:bamD [Daejeonella sp.]
RVTEASKLISDLRNKLETKAYANAKLFLETGEYDAQNYKSAVIAFRNVLRDYPDTKFAEEIEYLTIKAQYNYAKNSYEYKQEDRFNEVIQLYTDFSEKYTSSKYLKDAEGYKKDAEKRIVEVKKLLATQVPKEAKDTVTTENTKINTNE